MQIQTTNHNASIIHNTRSTDLLSSALLQLQNGALGIQETQELLQALKQAVSQGLVSYQQIVQQLETSAKSPMELASFRRDWASLQANQDAPREVKNAVSGFQNRFAEMAQDKDKFHTMMQQAYGSKYDSEKVENIRLSALKGDFSFIPSIKVVPEEGMNGGAAAYAKDTGTIYVSDKLLNSPELMGELITEEIGHHLDQLMGAGDAKGDEGEVFKHLLYGKSLHSAEVQRALNSRDSGTITVDGQEIEVEFGVWSKFKKEAKKVKDKVKGIGDHLKHPEKSLNPKKLFDEVKKDIKEDWKNVKDDWKDLKDAVKELNHLRLESHKYSLGYQASKEVTNKALELHFKLHEFHAKNIPILKKIDEYVADHKWAQQAVTLIATTYGGPYGAAAAAMHIAYVQGADIDTIREAGLRAFGTSYVSSYINANYTGADLTLTDYATGATLSGAVAEANGGKFSDGALGYLAGVGGNAIGLNTGADMTAADYAQNAVFHGAIAEAQGRDFADGAALYIANDVIPNLGLDKTTSLILGTAVAGATGEEQALSYLTSGLDNLGLTETQTGVIKMAIAAAQNDDKEAINQLMQTVIPNLNLSEQQQQAVNLAIAVATEGKEGGLTYLQNQVVPNMNLTEEQKQFAQLAISAAKGDKEAVYQAIREAIPQLGLEGAALSAANTLAAYAQGGKEGAVEYLQQQSDQWGLSGTQQQSLDFLLTAVKDGADQAALQMARQAVNNMDLTQDQRMAMNTVLAIAENGLEGGVDYIRKEVWPLIKDTKDNPIATAAETLKDYENKLREQIKQVSTNELNSMVDPQYQKMMEKWLAELLAQQMAG